MFFSYKFDGLPSFADLTVLWEPVVSVRISPYSSSISSGLQSVTKIELKSVIWVNDTPGVAWDLDIFLQSWFFWPQNYCSFSLRSRVCFKAKTQLFLFEFKWACLLTERPMQQNQFKLIFIEFFLECNCKHCFYFRATKISKLRVVIECCARTKK